MSLSRWLLVALGGGLGSLCRYGISGLAQRLFGLSFAWGTFAVNTLGCLMLGFMFAFAELKQIIPPGLRLFFMVGFLGAFTTFSTYSLETINLARQGTPLVALLNIVANNLVGLVVVLLGFWIGQNI